MNRHIATTMLVLATLITTTSAAAGDAGLVTRDSTYPSPRPWDASNPLSLPRA